MLKVHNMTLSVTSDYICGKRQHLLGVTGVTDLTVCICTNARQTIYTTCILIRVRDKPWATPQYNVYHVQNRTEQNRSGP